MDIFAKLTEVLADHTGRDASEFTPDTTFESLGIDSLETVEMVMELEEELDTELELDEKVSTVGELVAFSLRRSWLSNLSACSPCPTDRSIAEYDGRRPL